jgi:hypothetical protein
LENTPEQTLSKQAKTSGNELFSVVDMMWSFLPMSSIRQVQPLILRLHCQTGWGLLDIVAMTIPLTLSAALMFFEHLNTARILLITLASIALPSILFSHHIIWYAERWSDHLAELEDRRLSPLAFQLATSTFTFPLPVISIFIGTLPVYGILGWSFNTYFVQVLFSVVHFLIVLQVGKALGVIFRANTGQVIKAFTSLLFLSFLFSSVPLASWKLPSYLRWMCVLSVDFWAISGAVINQYNGNNYDNAEDCNDFLTCLLSDGSFIVRFLGFAPLSSSFRALGILTGWFISLVFLELYLLRRSCGFSHRVSCRSNRISIN